MFKMSALVLGAVLALPAAAQHWGASWYASPQAAWGADFALPTGLPAYLERQTVRETVRLSSGGRRVRVVLSNRYGGAPLMVGAASVARGGQLRMLTFGGQRQAVIAPGAPAVSDAVDLPVAALERLAVSVYLPQRTPLATFHWGAQQTAVVTPGDATGIAAAPGADDAAGAYGPDTAHAAASRASHAAPPLESLPGRVLVSAVLVESDQPARTVVAMGDSITDGNGSTPDRDRRWPDYLAARLAPGGVAVVNAGISGARLLGDRMGANAAARFEQDVLAQPGLATVVVLLGINDIGWPGSAFAPDEAPMTAQRMIAAYRQLIAQARVHGVRIVGGTMTPFEYGLQGTPFATHYSAAKDALRKEVNAWIRGSGEFDAVADFDAALRDPAHPARMLPRYDSGDHLHPGDAGYAAMAEILNDALLFGPRPH